MPAASAARTRFVTDELVGAIPHQDLELSELSELADFVTSVRVSRPDPAGPVSAERRSREALNDLLRQAPAPLDVWAYDQPDG